MEKYQVGPFTDQFNKPLGKELWKFLHERENIIRMITASDLQRPAVEPLSEMLLEKFGEAVKADRVKMMIGHMVKQVMEENNYILKSKNLKTRISSVFHFASRYEKK